LPSNLDFWARQVFAVIIGAVLSFLLSFLIGRLFLWLVTPVVRWPHLNPWLVANLSVPVIALAVGTFVGVLARTRPGILAALSLLPLVSYSFFSITRLPTFQVMRAEELITRGLLPIALMLAFGTVAAIAAFRFRKSKMQAATKQSNMSYSC